MPDFKTLRKAAGFKTQQSLSDASGVSLRTIKYIEGKDKKRISVDMAVKLAPVLGVPILTLLLEVNR